MQTTGKKRAFTWLESSSGILAIMTKICATCKIEKKDNFFYRKKGKYRHGLSGSCKVCINISQKAGRERRSEKTREMRRASRVKKRKEVEALKDFPCQDCGGSFPPYCMDFDHRDPSQKVASISTMRSLAFSLEKILREIAKCDLVCANCHRIRTWKNKHDGEKSTSQIIRTRARGTIGRIKDKKKLRKQRELSKIITEAE